MGKNGTPRNSNYLENARAFNIQPVTLLCILRCCFFRPLPPYPFFKILGFLFLLLWTRKKEGLSPSVWAHFNYLESFFPPILPLFTFTAMTASYSTPYPLKPPIDLRRRSVPASPLLHCIHLTERFCAPKVNQSGGSIY